MMTVELRTRRLRLRDFAPGEVGGVQAIVGDERVTRWLSFDARTRTEAEQMLAGILQRSAEPDRREYYLAVEDLQAKVVGFARLGLSGVRAAKLGYAISADAWGQGYATEAAGRLIRFGFEELGLHRITAAVGPENVASIRVLERLGMVVEGRLRDHVFTNGAWRDSVLFSLLSHELDRDGDAADLL